MIRDQIQTTRQESQRVISMIYLMIALLVSALSGILAHRLAVQKQRAPKPWIIASVLLVFPVFILTVLPSKRIERYQ